MYEIKFYKGDYRERQRNANADGAVAYVEHHFNSSSSPSAGYAVTIVGSNASQTSRNWGRWYARSVADSFGIKVGGNQGIMVGGYQGRGDGNVKHTSMPAVLLEPLFASNPRHAEWIRGQEGQEMLASVLESSIRRFFPLGGLIAFSVGHKYKTSRPADRGAAVHGGGTEADFAEEVLQRTEQRLQGTAAIEEDRTVRIEVNGRVISSHEVDVDSEIRWDPIRERLIIDELGASTGNQEQAMDETRYYGNVKDGAILKCTVDPGDTKVNFIATLVDGKGAQTVWEDTQVRAGIEVPLKKTREYYRFELDSVFRGPTKTTNTIAITGKEPWTSVQSGDAPTVSTMRAKITMEL